MTTPVPSILSRRRLLQLSALGGAGLALGPVLGSSRVLATAGSSPAPSTPADLRTLKVQLGWIANVENAGEFVADEKGYYAEEGLDPTLTPGGPQVSLEPTVVSGAALIGLSNADAIPAVANAEGAKLKIVGVTLQNNPSAVMSLVSNPVPDAKSLEGKKLGLQQNGEVIYDAFFQLAGVYVSTVTIVPVQFDPAPLVAGEVDAFASFLVNQPIALEAQGIKTVTFLLADYGYNIYADAFFVTEDTLADDEARDTVVRFLRATRRGGGGRHRRPGSGGADRGRRTRRRARPRRRPADRHARGVRTALIQTDDIKDHGLFWMTDDGIANNIATMKSVDIEVDESLASSTTCSPSSDPMAGDGDDPWGSVTTAGGLRADEVISTLQKSIRRADVRNAVLCAADMAATSAELDRYLWDRLHVIAVEDVGFGAPDAIATIVALDTARQRFTYGSHDRLLFVIHAVRLLGGSAKDRSNDELEPRASRRRGGARPQVPDHAIDMHTARGRGAWPAT